MDDRRICACSCLCLVVACSGGGGSNGESVGESIGESDEGTTTTGNSDSETETGSVPSSSCKRGLAYGHHSDADLAALQGSVTWWYNWAYEPDAELSAGTYESLGFEYVPMIWGGTFDVDAATAGIPSDAT